MTVRKFVLPTFENDFVLLTPKDMVTKDEAWINKDDLYHDFEIVCEAVPNEQLRAQINNYFMKVLPEEASLRQKRRAMVRTIRKYPQLIDAYIRFKEKRGAQAIRKSSRKVKLSEQMYLENFGELAELLHKASGFYHVNGGTYREALSRVHFLKDVIENKGGHNLFRAGPLKEKPISTFSIDSPGMRRRRM